MGPRGSPDGPGIDAIVEEGDEGGAHHSARWEKGRPSPARAILCVAKYRALI